MKLGLRGSKQNFYLQYHKINNKQCSREMVVPLLLRRRGREREEREEGKERGDERGEEEGERGGEEEGEEGREEEREERGAVKERIDWWLVRGVL